MNAPKKLETTIPGRCRDAGLRLPPSGSVVLWAGEKQKVLDWKDLKEYRGQRAQRGSVLPRGWPRKVDRLETQLPPAPPA